MRQLNQDLDILLSLKDPQFPLKKRLKDKIRLFKEMEDRHPQSSSAITYQIQDWKKELEVLPETGNQETQFETQWIDDSLYRLVANKIRAFRIYLNMEKKVFLEVKTINSNADFHISFYSEADDYSWYKKYSVLYDLGLSKKGHEQLERVTPVKNPKNLLAIKELLSRIVIGIQKDWAEYNRVYLEVMDF